MTEKCSKCGKEGTPYTSKSRPSKSGTVTYHKYFKHSETTGRSGQILQFAHYGGPISEAEFLSRRKKPVIESTAERAISTEEILRRFTDDITTKHGGRLFYKGEEVGTTSKKDFTEVLRLIIESIEKEE